MLWLQAEEFAAVSFKKPEFIIQLKDRNPTKAVTEKRRGKRTFLFLYRDPAPRKSPPASKARGTEWLHYFVLHDLTVSCSNSLDLGYFP